MRIFRDHGYTGHSWSWLNWVYGILLCFVLFVLWRIYKIPDQCFMCDMMPKCHPLCIVDISQGDVGILYVYDHPYDRIDEISSYQPGGFLEIYYSGGLRMMRAAGGSVTTEFPANKGKLFPAFFCRSCRRQLREYRNCRYVIADLYCQGQPVYYPIRDGAEYDVRCYTVTVDVDTTYTLTVRGNLE